MNLVKELKQLIPPEQLGRTFSVLKETKNGMREVYAGPSIVAAHKAYEEIMEKINNPRSPVIGAWITIGVFVPYADR